MNFQERKQLILRWLNEKPSIDVADLARKLRISEITVRRDLGVLAEKGLLMRTRGGAMNIKAAQEPSGFAQKVITRAEQKEYIGRVAATLVHDRDIIFMDCGTTVLAMAPYLRNRMITVITNSLPVADTFFNSRVRVNLIGGELDPERRAVHGTIATMHIARYKATKAFIGVDGISLKEGLSSNSEMEAENTKAMIECSGKTFLLADSSKLETIRYLKFAPVNVVNTLVTDKEASESLLSKYKKAGIEVVNSIKK